MKPQLGQVDIVSMDAKQRSVIVTSKARSNGSKTGDSEGSITPSVMSCSEPPPDVLSALSVSAGLNYQGVVKGDPNVGLTAALAAAESVGAIERTQTVNLLRESMFRTCERAANGLMNWKDVAVQSARDQRMATAVLAIEQLTTAARPGPIIVGGGTANSSLGGTAALKAASDAAAAEAVSEDKLTKANSVLSGLSTGSEDSGGSKNLVAGGSNQARLNAQLRADIGTVLHNLVLLTTPPT